MSAEISPTREEIDRTYQQYQKEAVAGGYYLNPDAEFARDLIKGILVNEKRYGYGNCPCRLASGEKTGDLDTICPCDYRDADVVEYGSCY